MSSLSTHPLFSSNATQNLRLWAWGLATFSSINLYLTSNILRIIQVGNFRFTGWLWLNTYTHSWYIAVHHGNIWGVSAKTHFVDSGVLKLRNTKPLPTSILNPNLPKFSLSKCWAFSTMGLCCIQLLYFQWSWQWWCVLCDSQYLLWGYLDHELHGGLSPIP